MVPLIIQTLLLLLLLAHACLWFLIFYQHAALFTRLTNLPPLLLWRFLAVASTLMEDNMQLLEELMGAEQEPGVGADS